MATKVLIFRLVCNLCKTVGFTYSCFTLHAVLGSPAKGEDVL